MSRLALDMSGSPVNYTSKRRPASAQMSSEWSAGTGVDSQADSKSKRRPKLLLLAWTFPPAASIASVRTWNLAKHLSRLGWKVTVVTPDPVLVRHIENPEQTKADLEAEEISQILTGHDFQFLDPGFLNYRNEGLRWLLGGICRKISQRFGISRGIGWIRPAERACQSLSPENVDLILASGPAFASFVLAERLSKRLGRPYILDYRDPWWTEVTGMLRVFQGLIDKLERRLVAGSQAVIVVSTSWASDLDRRFNIRPKLHVITNGYDPEDFADVKPHNFGHFAMVYTGIFYPPIRIIAPLLAALKQLKQKETSRQWCFHYYGENDEYVKNEAEKIGVTDRVKVHGKVPRATALSAVKGANVAVVIASVSSACSPEISGWIPAKLYEAVGLHTPVLLIAPPGSDAESIAKSTGLIRRFTGDETDKIAQFLEESITGMEVKREDADAITWNCLANQFDHVLRQQLVPAP